MFDIIEKFKIDDPVCNFKLKKHEIILSSLAINFLSLALPIMVLQVYDRIMLNHSTGTLSVLAIGVAVAVTLESILRVARSYTTGWAGMMYEYTLSANAMRYYINADPLKLKAEGTGSQIQSLSSFQKLRDFYSGQTLVTLVDIPFAIVFIILISYLTGILVLVPITLIVVFTIATWYMANMLKNAIEIQGHIDDKRYDFIIEALQGIHSIKSYGIEAVFKRRYERLEEESSLANYQSAITSTQGYTFAILFNELMVILVVSFGAPMVVDQKFTTGALIATVLLAGRLMQPIQKTLFLWNQFQDYRLAFKKAEEIFSIEQVERDFATEEIAKSGKIVVKNLTFGYGNTLLFKNINFELKIPEVIAIHGENNVGKSSLLRLIAGIILPTKGSVEIDGIEASKFTSEELIKHVGYISSDNVIFHGTILENLTAFDKTKEDKAYEMAKLLHIDKEISLMSKGYETTVNDGIADTVAPGIKQRIAIARVLINKPKIILFNNADKGLDKEGYNHLIKLLNLLKGKVTMVIVSEDHNINRLADREYVLENGKLQPIKISDSSIYDVKPYKELKI